MKVGTLGYNSVHPKEVENPPYGEGTAIGENAYAVAGSVAVGAGSRALNEGEFAVGAPGSDSEGQVLRRVSNVAAPEYDTDAATKKYVDSAIKVTDRRFPEWDSDNQEFTNSSIAEWLRYNSDGKLYGVEQSEDKVQACTKVLANAGMENPVPYTLAKAGSDPYRGKGPFRWYNCNARVDADGTQHVTGIEDFGNFSWDRDAWTLSPVRYVFDGEVGGRWRHVSCDTAQSGLVREARATLPNGDVAPYMLRAKFMMSLGSDGVPMTVAGAKPRLFDVSYSSMIGLAKKKGAAYSGLTYADDAYLYDMFLLKYANKSSQSVFAGCTGHSEQTQVTVANSASATVVIKKSVADLWPVGSSVEVGSHPGDTAGDRYDADMRDLASQAKIVGKEDYDGSNVALTLECDPFDSAVGNWVSTMPWETGTCKDLQGDGSPTSCTNWREPYMLQGIELALGAYEVLGDVIEYSAGDGWGVYRLSTTDKAATSLTSDFAHVWDVPNTDADSGDYQAWQKKSAGMWYPGGWNASSTSGTGDYMWWNKSTASGLREYLARGGLWGWGGAGLRYAHLDWGLGGAWWSIGGRLSANGLYGVNATA